MQQDELDRILASEIVPSAGFVSGVMEAVRREAAAPPPIPFPWLRALPALLAGLVAIVIAIVKSGGQPAEAAQTRSGILTSLAHAWSVAAGYGAGWIAMALLLSLVCTALSIRMATGGWRTL